MSWLRCACEWSVESGGRMGNVRRLARSLEYLALVFRLPGEERQWSAHRMARYVTMLTGYKRRWSRGLGSRGPLMIGDRRSRERPVRVLA